jgi:superfamily II DNA or RNA helicase
MQRNGVGSATDVAGHYRDGAELAHRPGVAKNHAVQESPFDVGQRYSEERLPAVGAEGRAVGDRRSPLVLTGRTNHLKYFEAALSGKVSNVFVLKGGMGKKQRRTIAEAMAAVPESEPRVILATGSYIGEGFDDARIDTLFLAMPISWKGTLQQYVGRLHRLHDAKHVVLVYDYVDSQVLMLERECTPGG